MLTPYEMGKYAALQELGLEKGADFMNLFRGAGRGIKSLWKGEGLATDAAKVTSAKGAKGAAKGTRKGRAAKGAPKEEEKGLLDSLPWWVKGMGLAGAGYGGYKLLNNPEPQGPQQQYFGPGNAYPQGQF
jgi:hypothetical protein